MKRVGLALSGGAVRGMAHLGVIRVLEEEGIPIDCVAGTSAGSLAGAFLAAGYGWEKLYDIAKDLAWRKLGGLTIPRKGILDGRLMEDYLEAELGRLNIEDLELPFAAVAVDLAEGKLAVFKHGAVAPAVRASCAIPGLFTPLEVGEHVYIDGGVMMFDPIQQVRDLGADYCIAVKLIPPLVPRRRPQNMIEVILATFELNMVHVARLEPDGDATIKPDLDGTDFYDFEQRDLLIHRGQEAARSAVEQIKRDLGIKPRMRPFRARTQDRR